MNQNASGLVKFHSDAGRWERALALTEATAFWIWPFLVERTVHGEGAQARENGLEALDLWALRTLLFLLLRFLG